MRVFEYEEKPGKEKSRALDALSILETMQELEEYNGITEEKILDNWYALKGQVRNALVAEIPKEQPKEEKNEPKNPI